ncbi:uncharacterized protein [Drosophila tropicalis]|uniref:uncharacterized protein n=1 Tax=Drosophila tropicalis TaxID=46794 RepID=UPI0035AB76EF
MSICPSVKLLEYNFVFKLLMTREAVVFKLTNAVCESSNESWVEFHNCRLKAVSRNKVLLNVNATVYKPSNSIDLRVEILKKANGYKPWLFNTTIDACRFQRQSYNPFIMLAFKQVKDFSNLNHTCPYVGSQIVKDLYLRPELLNNLPLPTGEYLIRLTWAFYGKHIYKFLFRIC